MYRTEGDKNRSWSHHKNLILILFSCWSFSHPDPLLTLILFSSWSYSHLLLCGLMTEPLSVTWVSQRCVVTAVFIITLFMSLSLTPRWSLLVWLGLKTDWGTLSITCVFCLEDTAGSRWCETLDGLFAEICPRGSINKASPSALLIL